MRVLIFNSDSLLKLFARAPLKMYTLHIYSNINGCKSATALSDQLSDFVNGVACLGFTFACAPKQLISN